MSKLEKCIYLVIILVLVTAIVSGSIYLVTRDKDNTNTNNNEEVNDKDKENNKGETEELIDGVKLIDVKKQGDNIVEKFEVTLNGKKNDLDLIFKNVTNDGVPYILGTFGTYDFYCNHVNVENVFSLDKIKTYFNENNFILIKGKDNKNYLSLVAPIIYGNSLYVLNDDLNIISGDIDDYGGSGIPSATGSFKITRTSNIPNGEFPQYKNTFGSIILGDSENIFVKVQDNKIYYLYPVKLDESNAIIEERVYEINNGNLSYEVINKYENILVGQQI